MKQIKKNSAILIAVVLLAAFNVRGQDTNLNFFDSNGVINQDEVITNDVGYSLTQLDNVAHDVVWAHVVYSIIDLRDKRNVPLAFPTGQDANFKNIFRLMADAVVGEAPVYYPNESGITPNFDTTNLVSTKKLSDVFFIETDVSGVQYIDPLFDYDSIGNKLSVSNRIYDRFSKRVNKILVQKIYYFDKHLSQFGSKIIAIAPLMAPENISSIFSTVDTDNETGETGDTTQELKTTLKESVLAWILYDDLKAHFSEQPVYQESNDALRISYHEFFTKKMFSDYMIGDNNLMKRLYGNNEKFTTAKITREIKDIQSKLIAIESGLY